MITHELRKIITVQTYSINNIDGSAIICYKKGDIDHTLSMGEYAVRDALLAIGSIDTKEEFQDYELSQWDALTIAIRHEYEKTNKGVDVLDFINTINQIADEHYKNKG